MIRMMRVLRLSVVGVGLLLSGCTTWYYQMAEAYINEPEVEIAATQNRYAIRSYTSKLFYTVNGQVGVSTTKCPEVAAKYQQAARTLYPEVFGTGGTPVDVVAVETLDDVSGGFVSGGSNSRTMYEFIVNGKRCPSLWALNATATATAGEVERSGGYRAYFEKERPLSGRQQWRTSYTRTSWPNNSETLPGSHESFSSETEAARPFIRAIARRLNALEKPQAAAKKAAVMKPRTDYTVKRFEKVAMTAYEFDIEYPEGADISDFKKNQASIRDLVQTDYAETNGANKSDVHVMFSAFNWDDNKLAGRAEVFEIEAPPYHYDAYTRRGKLSARIVNGDFGKARKWAIKHIEAIARSKNILLITGEDPPLGMYKLLDEKVKDDNTLELSFEVE